MRHPLGHALGTGRNYLRTIYESPDVTVIEHVVAKRVSGRTDVVSLAYRACSRPTGRQTLIYSGSPGSGPFPSIGFDARGNWLVYGHFIGSGQITQDSGSLHSLDVRTGKRGPVVNQGAGAVHGGGDHAIDAVAPSAITDLTVRGQTITWVVGGSTKTAVLP